MSGKDSVPASGLERLLSAEREPVALPEPQRTFLIARLMRVLTQNSAERVSPWWTPRTLKRSWPAAFGLAAVVAGGVWARQSVRFDPTESVVVRASDQDPSPGRLPPKLDSVRAVAAEPPQASETPQTPEAFADPLPVPTSAAPGKARELGDIQEELAELERARSAQQRGHHLQALRSIEAHQRRYPRSIFSEEREALAVSALGKLDRTAEARTRARAFARRYPRSVFVSKLSPWLAE